MLSYVFKYKGLVINDFEAVKEFLKGQRKWVMTLEEIDGIHTADVRHSETPLMGRHGIYDAPSYLGKRVITLAGSLVAKSEKDILDAIKYIKTVFGLPAVYTDEIDGYDWMYIDNNDLNYHYKIKVKTYKLPDFKKTLKEKNKRKFIIQVKAADPRFYSQEEIVRNIKRTWFQPGARISAKIPLKLSTVSVRRVNLYNDGTTAVAPYIKLYGPLKNPEIINVTTGVKMKVNVDLKDNEYLTIDVNRHKILKDNGENCINNLSEDSGWLWLYPGDNYIDLFDDNETPLATGILPIGYGVFKYSYAIM